MAIVFWWRVKVNVAAAVAIATNHTESQVLFLSLWYTTGVLERKRKH